MSDPSPTELLELWMAESGTTLDTLTPETALDLMVRLHLTDAHCHSSVVCSWGPVQQYGVEEWGFDISRRWWPMRGEEILGYWRVHFRMRYGPGSRAKPSEGWKEEGCGEPEQLDALRARLAELSPFDSLKGSPAEGAILVFEEGVPDPNPLYDCWGVRDPSRPVIDMTDEEWQRTEDVPRMLRWMEETMLGDEAELGRGIQRYFFACCRQIWWLLTPEEIRSCFEVAERHLEGRATDDELGRAKWHAEVAPCEPGAFERWVQQLNRYPREVLAAALHGVRPEDDLSPAGLAQHAHYFAFMTMHFSGTRPWSYMSQFRIFLPAQLLRDHIDDPFRVAPSTRQLP